MENLFDVFDEDFQTSELTSDQINSDVDFDESSLDASSLYEDSIHVDDSIASLEENHLLEDHIELYPMLGEDISFKAREDMLPFDEQENFRISSEPNNPFAIYISRHDNLEMDVDDFSIKPDLPIDFTKEQLQEACNQISDVLGIDHLPVFVTSNVPNCQFQTINGPFLFTSFDDCLSFNPEYLKKMVNDFHSTDIILSDAGHELGHAMTALYCGNLSTYADEKMADLISGYVNCKMGIDVDQARQWFQMYYDSEGLGGYPVSEERWDIESAGYYLGHYLTSDELKTALKDPEFVNLVVNYKSDTSDLLQFQQEVYSMLDPVDVSKPYREFLDKIKKYAGFQRF